MKWCIPAKTFLLGEYAAVAGESAIVITTSPFFSIALSNKSDLLGIHPDSPAGRWWSQQGHEGVGIEWTDPYGGCGGLGASSAQFLGVYLASMHLREKKHDQQEMLQAYVQSAWQGQGLRPSGYDVLAQSLHDCVYINRQRAVYQTMAWPFSDLGFILLHMGQKLATHQHLQAITLPRSIHLFSDIVDSAKIAFLTADSQKIVEAINAYHQQLLAMKLVSDHTLAYVTHFKQCDDVLAVKGCGAMGSDVLLLLVRLKKQTSLCNYLASLGWIVLATSNNLYTNASLIENS